VDLKTKESNKQEEKRERKIGKSVGMRASGRAIRQAGGPNRKKKERADNKKTEQTSTV
jgi:hypothetical protein